MEPMPKLGFAIFIGINGLSWLKWLTLFSMQYPLQCRLRSLLKRTAAIFCSHAQNVGGSEESKRKILD